MSKSSDSAVWGAVVGAVVTVVVTAALGGLAPAWAWVVSLFGALWSHLRGISALPNWGVYLLLLMAIQSLMYWAFRWMGNRKDSISRYNQDDFLNVRWRWSFISGTVRNLLPYCPHCSTSLVYSHDGGMFSDEPEAVSLHCEHCSGQMTTSPGRKDDLLGRVTRQIHRKVENGEWRAVADAAKAM